MDQRRWQKFSLPEQLANIGSEVNRFFHWKMSGDAENQNKALERALDLIDLTLKTPLYGTSLKELCRLREIIKDLFIGKKEYSFSPRSIQDYFLMFAVAARKNR
ncbi:MAG: hypothetical protein COY66_03900 [Candidatus Kerfeldbacteria bacterium CG_4_10_14_0_8_um_filter_42_10]|uniref:Uncharacterized protein n=1 Tax=Candidatus Kerfeldbacteria bacterium CG_4_10_14_0_8_um_filter_42_10 TaxID=2014248 RepID=A0A2M7RJL1_9BACT|nr:MAG: hypothetical protein COY66_03900 [Candidatus Kerfeldbacteria bacterium CG_4_10_14_0_8_um_filter_42_10]